MSANKAVKLAAALMQVLGPISKGIFSGMKMAGASLRQDPWKKKKRSIDRGFIPKGACYNKSILQLYARARKNVHAPAKPTSKTLMFADGRTSYRIFTDGSYRRIKAVSGRRLIPV